MNRKEMLNDLYAQFNEDDRLCKSRQGQLEYLVTMTYIHKFLTPGCRVLEIAEDREDFSMTEEDFAAFADYQLHVCEKRELLGLSSHLLYICKKR